VRRDSSSELQRHVGLLLGLEESALYAASDHGWTLVRPPRLTDGPATGSVPHDAHQSQCATTLSRADHVVFLIDVLERHLYPRSAPFVASRKPG